MKHSEALIHLRNMLFALQRARSIEKETLSGGDISEAVVLSVLEATQPWIWDDAKCPIPVLVQAIDRAENGQPIEPLFFQNMIFIATHLEPSISYIVKALAGDETFPDDIDIQWLKGWEPEDGEED